MKIGIALSGGGIRGAAHIGVLKALEENNIKIDMISGTSAGSIVASLYAMGYSPDELSKTFKEFQYKSLWDYEYKYFLPFLFNILLLGKKKNIIDFDIVGIFAILIGLIFKKNIKIDGFIKGNRIEKIIFELSQKANKLLIKDAKIPLAIPSVDINSAENVVFTSKLIKNMAGDDTIYIDDATMYEAVRSSIAFPVIFKPKIFRGRHLVDGGLRDNVPVEILSRLGADKIIAVNLGYSGQNKNSVSNIFEIATQSVEIMAYQVSKTTLSKANFVLKPEIYDVSLLENSRIEECIERGYISANKAMDDIKTALGSLVFPIKK